MTLISEIAKLARLGDVPGINKLLDESPEKGNEIVWGRGQADRLLRRDPPLPPADALKIGPGESMLPSIYPESPFRSAKKRAA